MRAQTGLGLVAVMVAGCARASSEDGSDAPETPHCTQAQVARCGDIEVTVTPLAGGIVKLRYAAAGAPVRPSWSVLAAPVAECSEDIAIEIDAACRVRATLADGTVIAADAEPFTAAVSAAGEARLVRTAN